MLKPEQLSFTTNGLVPSVEALTSMLGFCTFVTPWGATMVSWPLVGVVLRGALDSGLPLDDVRLVYDLWLTLKVGSVLPLGNSPSHTWEILINPA